MSVNRNRSKLNKSCSNIEYRVLLNRSTDYFCPYCSPVLKHCGTPCMGHNRKLFKYREYRSWKHNRKTKYKIL